MYIYLFSGTHWDREWYRSFQGFRYLLVEMLDRLVYFFESEDSESVFHLDGQTILLEDYAEINPEGYDRLKKLISGGRVLIGPWYCMPDEFLVSGEALIRNLLRGFALCRAAGAEPWKCGYICDIFGHNAQMPQILSGFGIDNAVLGRGTNEHSTPPVFVWQGIDGSRVTVMKIPDNNAYGDFTGEVSGQRVAGFATNPDSPEFEDKIKAYVEKLRGKANTDVIVLWNALDHEPFHEQSTGYVRRMKQLFPNDEVFHCDLLHGFEKLRGISGLPVRSGELRETGRDLKSNYIQVLTHVLSSRQSLKQRNDACQALLEKRLEPALLVLEDFGFKPKDAYRQTAWKHLLQNHPHDSICGCSIDRVHEDMAYRFSQAESIAETILNEGLWKMIGGLRFAGVEAKYLSLLHTNPLPNEDILSITIPFHKNSAKWHEPLGYEDIAAFRLYSEDNKEIPYAISGMKLNGACSGLGGSNIPCDLYTVWVPVKACGLGITDIEIRPVDEPVRFFGELADRRGCLDNGIIRAGVNPDGSIDLHDYRTDRTYKNLLSLLDDAEIGDGWDHANPVADRVISLTELEEASVICNNPLVATLRVVRNMVVPSSFEQTVAGLRRSDKQAIVRFEFLITLKHESYSLQITLKVNNTAKDHRLRLLLPTGFSEGQYEANQDFCFVRRSCQIDHNTRNWKEPCQREAPMNGIFLKRAGNGEGLAFVSAGGLHECSAWENGDLAVTLLRGFGRTMAATCENGGQELFEHQYQFDLIALTEDISRTVLQNHQDGMYSAPETRISDKRLARTILHVDGAVCISAVKPPEAGGDGIILRMYNVEDHASNAVLRMPGLSRLFRCDMLEIPREEIAVRDNEAELDVKPGEIVTLLCIR